MPKFHYRFDTFFIIVRFWHSVSDSYFQVALGFKKTVFVKSPGQHVAQNTVFSHTLVF